VRVEIALRRLCEPGVIGGHEGRGVRIGFADRADAAQSQLLHETVLQRKRLT
jgi:hypothetical protein